MRPSVSVVIATHNRSSSLRETLASIAAADRGTLRVEVVIADNGSTDDTVAAVAEMAGILPVRYVHAPAPGKNRALNRVLDEGGLGEIVVFTDDDVFVDAAWLRQIDAACRDRPDTVAFGGRILPRWPSGVVRPGWTDDANIREFGFALQDIGDEPRAYPPLQFPFGPNLWLRGHLFEQGLRYREELGPSWNATMGSETFLLRDLVADGHRPVYWPAAVVEHRIRPEQYDPAWIVRRAEVFGRVMPHLFGPPAPERWASGRWRLERRATVLRSRLQDLGALLQADPDARVVKRVWAAYARGLNHESLCLPEPVSKAR